VKELSVVLVYKQKPLIMSYKDDEHVLLEAIEIGRHFEPSQT
jgi:hypothetical protein